MVEPPFTLFPVVEDLTICLIVAVKYVTLGIQAFQVLDVSHFRPFIVCVKMSVTMLAVDSCQVVPAVIGGVKLDEVQH